MMLVADILTGAIRGAVEQVVRSPLNNAPREQAREIAAQVVAEVRENPKIKEVVAQVTHATNSEPWFLSRVTWGAIVAILGGLQAEASMLMNGGGSLDGHYTALSAIAGGAVVIYGRWVATKPIGA